MEMHLDCFFFYFTESNEHGVALCVVVFRRVMMSPLHPSSLLDFRAFPRSLSGCQHIRLDVIARKHYWNSWTP